MSMPSTSQQALTVLVAPHTGTDEVFGVLADYSAVGLLAAFVWVDAADVGGASTPATVMHDGRAEPAVLQQLLTARRYQRIRVVVLVPTEAPPNERVPLAAEQMAEQTVRSSSMGARISLLRVLLSRGVAAPAARDSTLVLEGWHNLLVAPDDSAGPGLGAVSAGPVTDPLDFAQYTAPVIAGLTGLWAGLEQTPFDTLEILPGQTVRAARAFYRRLDSSEVEERLRAQLFDPAGHLPLPRGGEVPVVYVENVAAATQTMARALWTKHRDVLRGPRLSMNDVRAQAISIWAALKLFFRFMGAALRQAPGAWWSAVTGSVSSVLASTVQGTVFGGRDSAFAVVTNTDVANWQDLGRSADTLTTALGGEPPPQHLAQQDLGALWTDFVNGALTLADGGRRVVGLEPVPVGSGVGVVAASADVVPSVAESFSAIPTSLSAVIGMSSVEPADVLGVANLRERLQRAYSDPAAGVEARTAGTELDGWHRFVSRSYAWQVGSILADFLHRARGEVAQLAGEIQQAANRVSADERLQARQRAIGVILKTMFWALVLVLVVLVGIAALGWVRWPFALWTGGVMLGLYIVVSLGLFLFSQRDLFAEKHLRQSQLGELEMMQANLRAALQDVSRLSTAYGQLLSWCRVLGAVLRAPFGPAPAPRPSPGQLFDGLPRSTQLGVADPDEQQAGDAVHAIQRRLYALGWLTPPWQDMIREAAARLREEPEMLFRMPGIGTQSGLDQWSYAVGAGHVQPAGADALWGRVEQMFAEGQGEVAEALTGTVLVPGLDRHVPAQQFAAGITEHRDGRAAPFDASLFTHTAMTAGRASVAVDEAAVVRGGLGYRAAVVQASDGLPPYDFAIFEPPVPAAVDGEDDVMSVSGRERRDVPPRQDMVF
ncbi:hypothetical protein ABGB19_22630 [Mycobacterium sp. B14F4]|uniref:hypothetical protein n=1 Tax=Mycobacterium sp. B14F4 TaxID=3153565 RepID=UPI00325EBEDC